MLDDKEYPDSLEDLILQLKEKKDESLNRLKSPLYKYPLDVNKKVNPINLTRLPHFIASNVIGNIDDYIAKINFTTSFPSYGDVGKIKVLDDIYSKMDHFFGRIEVFQREANYGIGLIQDIYKVDSEYYKSHSEFILGNFTIFIDEVRLSEELKNTILAEKGKMERWRSNGFKVNDDSFASDNEPFWITILIKEKYIKKSNENRYIWLEKKGYCDSIYTILKPTKDLKSFCNYFDNINYNASRTNIIDLPDMKKSVFIAYLKKVRNL